MILQGLSHSEIVRAVFKRSFHNGAPFEIRFYGEVALHQLDDASGVRLVFRHCSRRKLFLAWFRWRRAVVCCHLLFVIDKVNTLSFVEGRFVNANFPVFGKRPRRRLGDRMNATAAFCNIARNALQLHAETGNGRIQLSGVAVFRQYCIHFRFQRHVLDDRRLPDANSDHARIIPLAAAIHEPIFHDLQDDVIHSCVGRGTNKQPWFGFSRHGQCALAIPGLHRNYATYFLVVFVVLSDV
mmetsp:Transcript_24979/g.70092  ORF Transcript_24979/g.70092 Transcript_24979/m.70092 type:complete len:240 (-) Transcript_24979:1634-2353(-)